MLGFLAATSLILYVRIRFVFAIQLYPTGRKVSSNCEDAKRTESETTHLQGEAEQRIKAACFTALKILLNCFPVFWCLALRVFRFSF